MKTPNPIEMLENYSNAGYPAICVETYEEARLTRAILELFPDRPASTINASQTLTNLRDGKQKQATFAAAFRETAGQEDSILIALDFRHVVNSAAAYRPLLSSLAGAKANHCLFILIGPTWQLPEELKHEIPVIQVPLPSPAELNQPLAVAIEGINAARADDRARPGGKPRHETLHLNRRRCDDAPARAPRTNRAQERHRLFEL